MRRPIRYCTKLGICVFLYLYKINIEIHIKLCILCQNYFPRFIYYFMFCSIILKKATTSQQVVKISIIIFFHYLYLLWLKLILLTLALLRAHICAHYRVCATMRGAHICAFQWKTDDHILSGWFFFILLLFSGKSLWNI